MSQVMEHIHQLAGVIGPRPATTDAEVSAADYIEDVFRGRGLDVERQEFDCPRTYSWPLVICHVLTIGAAALSLVWSWPALALAALAAVLLWLEVEMRFSISRFLPKGPSQNLIARHVPRVRRGERLKRVVILAHYDSAVSSLAFSPGLAKNVRLMGQLSLGATLLTTFVILIGALPFAAEWGPWTGYVALVAAAYLLVPLFINVHRELLMHASDGANGNASGVAAMLGVMEATVPEADVTSQRTQPLRRGLEAAYEADVVPEDAALEYRDVGTGAPGPVVTAPFDSLGDVDWETGPIVGAAGASASGVAPEPAPSYASAEAVPRSTDERAADTSEPASDTGEWATDTSEWAADTGSRAAGDAAAESAPASTSWVDEGPGEGQGSLELDYPQEVDEEPEPPTASRRGRGRDQEGENRGVRDWLGVGRGFDVRRAGKEIGTWDNLDSDEEDEFGFKAGTAGDDPDDEIARIRRRVTESVDRALSEKEIWFVATGANGSGAWGMRELLDAYPDDLHEALIINIDSVGAGTLACVTEEGAGRRLRADRRLVSQARRTARDRGMSVKSRPHRAMWTDATPALSRRFRAMSIMGFDINGRIPDRNWHSDTYENVVPATVEQAVALVTAIVRDL